MHIHNLYIYIHIFMCMRCKNIQIPTHTLSLYLSPIHSFFLGKSAIPRSPDHSW